MGAAIHENQQEQKLKCKILVVDDEPGCRRFLAWELKAQGYEVVTAENGKDGLLRFDEQAFPLMITDVRMRGGMDGMDFIQACRKRNSGQKVIFITGYAVEEKLEEALRHEGTLCLKKPFELEELLSSISALLEKS